MLWFHSKKFEIEIRDKEIEANMRRSNDGIGYLTHLWWEDHQAFEELVRKNKLGSNTISILLKMAHFRVKNSGKLLYRGIDKKNYKYFLKYGNDKTSQNISFAEADKLKEYGLSSFQVVYADHSAEKAWEYVYQNNPSIIIIYDADMLQRFPSEFFLYTLKKGADFRDAVKAYVIIKYT